VATERSTRLNSTYSAHPGLFDFNSPKDDHT
jgi:hypothetical protein